MDASPLGGRTDGRRAIDVGLLTPAGDAMTFADEHGSGCPGGQANVAEGWRGGAGPARTPGRRATVRSLFFAPMIPASGDSAFIVTRPIEPRR
jgi:hypothetical protein